MPLALPLAPPVTSSQVESLAAVHAQPLPAVTPTVPVVDPEPPDLLAVAMA